MKQIVANYAKYGWSFKRALLSKDARAECGPQLKDTFGDIELIDSDFNALWFARPSHENREAWELRLLAEQPYALFEAFETDEAEEDREGVRREMENRMREHLRR